MKNLSPVWFLESPIDAEHKHYLLLAFLQDAEREMGNNNIYFPVKRIFSLIKELNYFIGDENFVDFKKLPLSVEDEITVNSHLKNPISQKDQDELILIAKNSLEILYRYAEIGINIWKEIESRIKIFHLELDNSVGNSGIIIFRNMPTNEVIPYWWKKTEMKVEERIKNGVILKKIYIPNSYFSMSYEFIAHETMISLGMSGKVGCTIIEISEDFNQNSEIFKIAKDKFIQDMGQKN